MDFFLLGILLPLLILIGIVANIFSFVALQKLTLVRGSTYLSLLRWQALLDSSLLLTFFLISSLAELSSTYRHSFFPWTVPFLLPLGHIFLTGRVYGLVSITAEQLLITIGHRLADRGALIGYILPSAVLAALSNFPQWLSYQTAITEEGLPEVVLTEARSSREHIYLLFSNLFFDALLPAVLFSTLILGFFFHPGSRTGRLRNPLPLLFCILLNLLSNIPRHTLDMEEAAQALTSSSNPPPPWSQLLSKLALPLAPALTSITLLLQVSRFLKPGDAAGQDDLESGEVLL